jgi:hypothetical protein
MYCVHLSNSFLLHQLLPAPPVKSSGLGLSGHTIEKPGGVALVPLDACPWPEPGPARYVTLTHAGTSHKPLGRLYVGEKSYSVGVLTPGEAYTRTIGRFHRYLCAVQ